MVRAREIVTARRRSMARRTNRGVADPAIVMITIVVLVALALGGMFFGRGFVEQARDTNAQNDLARVAAAEEFYAASESRYTSSLADLKDGRVSFTTSTDVTIEIAANELGWVASATHTASGNVWYRASDEARMYQVGPGSEADAATAGALPAPAVPTGSGLTWSQVEQIKS